MTYGNFELKSVSEAIADFLYEDAVTAKLVAGIKEPILGGVVDVVTVDDELKGIGCVREGTGKMEFLVVGFVVTAVVEDVEFRRGNGDETRAVDELPGVELAGCKAWRCTRACAAACWDSMSSGVP